MPDKQSGLNPWQIFVYRQIPKQLSASLIICTVSACRSMSLSCLLTIYRNLCVTWNWDGQSQSLLSTTKFIEWLSHRTRANPPEVKAIKMEILIMKIWKPQTVCAALINYVIVRRILLKTHRISLHVRQIISIWLGKFIVRPSRPDSNAAEFEMPMFIGQC